MNAGRAPAAMVPSGTRAPAMIGPTPPDRQQMSLQQHFEAILSLLAVRPPTPLEAEMCESFIGQLGQALGAPDAALGGQQDPNQPPMPGGNAASMMGPEQDYGTAPGTSPALGY